MSNDFEWNEHDFVDKYINIKDTKNKILSTESVKLFKIFFFCQPNSILCAYVNGKTAKTI